VAPFVFLLLAAQPNPYLAQAKVLHQGLDYEKCLRRLEQATRWENSHTELAEIELYSGLCAFGVGKVNDAREHFDLALKIEPDLKLPPLLGPKLTELFERARARHRGIERPADSKPPPPPPPQPTPAPVEAKPVAPAPPPAVPVEARPLEAEAAPEPKPHRFVAPLLVGGVALVSGGFASYFGYTAKTLETRTKDPSAFESDSIAWARQAKDDALISNLCWAVAGVALIAAVITWFVLN
jgi:hypothetical protein